MSEKILKHRNYSANCSSDDGYNSDLEMKRERQRWINRDIHEFKRKYDVQELINNSANGVIYSGILLIYV